MKEDYISVREFAQRTGYTEASVYRAIRSGKLKSENFAEGFSTKKMIPKSELDRFLK